MPSIDPIMEQLREIYRRLGPEGAKEFQGRMIDDQFARPSVDGTILRDPEDGRPYAEFVPLDSPAGESRVERSPTPDASGLRPSRQGPKSR